MEELRNEIAELKKIMIEIKEKPVFTSIDDYQWYEYIKRRQKLFTQITKENLQKSADVFQLIKQEGSLVVKPDDFQFFPTEPQSPYLEVISPSREEQEIQENKIKKEREEQEEKLKQEKSQLIMRRSNAILWNKHVDKVKIRNQQYNQNIRDNNLNEPLLPEGNELNCLYQEIPEIN